MRKYAALEIKGLPPLQAGLPRTKRPRKTATRPRLTGGAAPKPPTASGIAASGKPEEIEWSEDDQPPTASGIAEELMLF